MKTVILSNTKKEAGGVERYSSYLRDTLESMGHSVAIIAIEDIGTLPTFFLKCSKIIGMQQPLAGYMLGRVARSMKADLYVTNGLLGWNITNKKTINVQHGTFARSAERIDRHANSAKYFVKRYVWGYFEGLAARRASTVVAVSEETRESVQKYYNVSSVTVIPNCIDTELFSPKDARGARKSLDLQTEGKIVCFVGRYEHAKGNDILEGLLPFLAEIHATLVLAVPNAEAVPLHPHIIARQFSQAELSKLYAASDVFLLPSLHEGSSYALLEAMASGTPFLASPVGLVSSFAHNGMFAECIVHDHTAEAYQKSLVHLLGLPTDEHDDLTQQLRDTILAEHSLPFFFQSYKALIETLL